MTQLTFDEWACRNALAKLDSYIDNELLVETNLEIARHFEQCAACAHEAKQRRELRARLRAAAGKVPAPSGLEERVRARLRKEGRSRPMPWRLMSIAAAVLLCFGGWLAHQRTGLPAQIAADLRIGTGDHRAAADAARHQYRAAAPTRQPHGPAVRRMTSMLVTPNDTDLSGTASRL